MTVAGIGITCVTTVAVVTVVAAVTVITVITVITVVAAIAAVAAVTKVQGSDAPAPVVVEKNGVAALLMAQFPEIE